MNTLCLTLFLLGLSPLVLSGVKADKACQDFTVGDCHISSEMIIWDHDKMTPGQCQVACSRLFSCLLFRHDGTICYLLNQDYRKTCDTAGAPAEASVEDCEDVILNTCSGFVEEDCSYIGEDLDLDPPDGEISNALECQQYCRDFDFLGCKYWVFNHQYKSCHLRGSGERDCAGISGPKEPPIDECMITTTPTTSTATTPTTSTATTLPTTTTTTTPAITTTTVSCPRKDFRAVSSLDICKGSNDTCGGPVIAWEFREEGKEVYENVNGRGGIALGDEIMYDIDFNGTFVVNAGDDDFVGFVFGFQDEKNFFVVHSPRVNVSNGFYKVGWRLTKVASSTGTVNSTMQTAIMANTSVEGQTEILWVDDQVRGWLVGISYKWFLQYRPSSGTFRLRLYQEEQEILDSGIGQNNCSGSCGGKMGVFSRSQPGVTWTDMVYICNTSPL